jgi:hypothetical protein
MHANPQIQFGQQKVSILVTCEVIVIFQLRKEEFFDAMVD